MQVTTRQKAFVVNKKSALKALRETKSALLSGVPAQLAASVAYFGTLSFFPLVAALVAVTSLVLDSAQIVNVVNGMATYLPADIAMLLSTQLQSAAAQQHNNVIVMVVALALSVLGVSGATDSIIKAITTIYHLKDERTFIHQKLLSIGLTISFIIGMAAILPLVFIGDAFLTRLGVPADIIAVFSVARWFLLIAIAVIGIGIVYHVSLPGKRTWRWVSWGSTIATTLWLAITAALFIYLQNFANFSDSYSLFAGIIALMIWINVSALTLLVGASVNCAFDQTQTPKKKP